MSHNLACLLIEGRRTYPPPLYFLIKKYTSVQISLALDENYADVKRRCSRIFNIQLYLTVMISVVRIVALFSKIHTHIVRIHEGEKTIITTDKDKESKTIGNVNIQICICLFHCRSKLIFSTVTIC